MQALRSTLRRRAPASAFAARSFSSSPSHSVARIIITGRLAAEPELQATSTGQDVIKYAVGTSYGPRDNRQTSWFRISSFPPEGPQKDYLLGLQKGCVRPSIQLSCTAHSDMVPCRTLVYVEGDASMRSYEDADGKRQSSLSVVQSMSLWLLRLHYLVERD
jgi:hypothetical protein